MIGIATKLAALDILQSRPSAAADPALTALGPLITTHSGYAYFGALGTARGNHAGR